MNPLFNMMQGQNGLMQRFQQFQQMFRGDPRQQVQNLLNSGRVSQQDYNRAVQMANQLRGMLGK
jgi:hypothetical protein